MVRNEFQKSELKDLISATVNFSSAAHHMAITETDLFQKVTDKFESLFWTIEERQMANYIDLFDVALWELVDEGIVNSIVIDGYDEIAYLNPKLLWK